jgi:hypothetical protein
VRVVESARGGWVFVAAAILATVAGVLARVWLPGAFASGAGAVVALTAGCGRPEARRLCRLVMSSAARWPAGYG